MRIVGGELGGRRIRAPRGPAVRPTGDRVRESLFSILGEVSGLDVLDLFCGTGALGIEALSRGARAATFVDIAIGTAARNVSDLGIGPRCQLVGGDALTFLRREEPAYDLVFCDPPYRLARRLGSDLDRLLPSRLRAGARVIVETATGEGTELPGLPLIDERTYGGTQLRIHGSGAS